MSLKRMPASLVRWLRDLRSGDFKQTQNYLCRIDSAGEKAFCCLGLFAHKDPRFKGAVSGKAFGDNYKNYEYGPYRQVYATELPEDVFRDMGLEPSLMTRLIDMNDCQGSTFAEVADVIEDHWKVNNP